MNRILWILSCARHQFLRHVYFMQFFLLSRRASYWFSWFFDFSFSSSLFLFCPFSHVELHNSRNSLDPCFVTSNYYSKLINCRSFSWAGTLSLHWRLPLNLPSKFFFVACTNDFTHIHDLRVWIRHMIRQVSSMISFKSLFFSSTSISSSRICSVSCIPDSTRFHSSFSLSRLQVTYSIS